MPSKYAKRRKMQTTGNSVCVTIPQNFAEDRDLVDQDGRPRDVEFEVIETDDGAIKFRPADD